MDAYARIERIRKALDAASTEIAIQRYCEEWNLLAKYRLDLAQGFVADAGRVLDVIERNIPDKKEAEPGPERSDLAG